MTKSKELQRRNIITKGCKTSLRRLMTHGTFFKGILPGAVFEQHCLSTHFYLDIGDWSWALCLTWLPVDGSIAQKVCINSLKVPRDN